MIVTDAGPLIAILDRRDQDHDLCVAALSRLRGPMITTCPAFTEAIHILGARVGWKAQDALLKLAMRGDLSIAQVEANGLLRCQELMSKYRDLPMDFADATLVALAEQLRTRRVFTLDDDFKTYRFAGKQPFTIVPRL